MKLSGRPVEGDDPIHILWGEGGEDQGRSGADQLHHPFFQVELGRSLLLLPAQVGPFHDQQIHVARADLFDQGRHHPRLAAMLAKVAGIEDGLALCFSRKATHEKVEWSTANGVTAMSPT